MCRALGGQGPFERSRVSLIECQPLAATDVENGVNTIAIDSERCKACYLCMEVCPRNCIEQSGAPNAAGYYPARFIEDSECLACALCGLVCPDVAITVLRDVDEPAPAAASAEVKG